MEIKNWLQMVGSKIKIFDKFYNKITHTQVNRFDYQSS